MHTACEAGTSGRTAPLQPNTLADPQWLLTTQDTWTRRAESPDEVPRVMPTGQLAKPPVQERLHRGPILPYLGSEQPLSLVAATKAL